MIQHVWTVLCSKALEDKHSHNVSLIETIVSLSITVPSEAPEDLPLITDFTLANVWYNDGEAKETAVVRTSIIRASGKESESIESRIEVTPKKFHKLFTHIRNITLDGPGIYQFVVRVKGGEDERWKRVATIPLKVVYNIDEDAALIRVPIGANL